MKGRIFYRLFLSLMLFAFLITPAFVYAASIYLAPASGNYEVGEQFSINVFVSSDGKEMNAVEATISSPGGNLQIVSVSQAGSIIDFWAQEPQINGNSSVYFEGVMLGMGYSGSAGKLATLVVRARSQGDTTLAISSGSVLANDGQGTNLPTTLGTAHFKITDTGLVPAPAKEALQEGITFTKDLRQGDSGNEVEYLQTCLREQGFYTEEITGYFGDHTKQAVVDFQEKYFDSILAPWGFEKGTGLVQETTRTKLTEICFAAPAASEPEVSVDAEPLPIKVTEEGREPFYSNVWFWVGVSAVLAITVILLLVVIILILFRHTHKLQSRAHQRSLSKRELMLRKSKKDLLVARKLIDRDLDKVERELSKSKNVKIKEGENK